MVTWIDYTQQFLWVDDLNIARLYPNSGEQAPFADKSRHAVCFYETAKHKHYEDDEAEARGYIPRGFVHFYQESPEKDVFVHWSVTGLREECWTEGHIHYKGDLHYDVLARDAIYENVHINPYQGFHDENFEDRDKETHRHMGDITLLKGDKDGRAEFVRYDKLITLYGEYGIYGRMCDMHFPKSCTKEGFEKFDVLEPQEEFKLVNIIEDKAKDDQDGSYPNDKRGISFGVIGHVTEDWVDEKLYKKNGLFKSDYLRNGPKKSRR